MLHPYQWSGLVVLLLLSAVFSGTETALTALSKIKIKHLQEKLGSGGRILDKWLLQPRKLLITILVGNNLVNIAASSVATSLAIEIANAHNYSHSKAVGITTGVVTFIVLIFGEIAPKTYAHANAEKIAPTALRFMYFLSLIIYPIVILLSWISTGITFLLGGKAHKAQPFLILEELQAAVSAGEKEGLLKEQEKEMIEGVFEFANTRASEIMVPRIDIFGIELSAALDEIISQVSASGFSRVPVYKEKMDTIAGILYAKDLLELAGATGETTVTLEELIRPVQYVPTSIRLDELLRTFKTAKTHLAIVVDEYGGTAGLVTFEDVLEEIVGDIEDEFDRSEAQIRQIDTDTFEVDAKTDIEKVNQELGLELPEEGFESLGGVITNLFGNVPAAGEVLEHNGARIIVAGANRKRIKTLQIILPSNEAEE